MKYSMIHLSNVNTPCTIEHHIRSTRHLPQQLMCVTISLPKRCVKFFNRYGYKLYDKQQEKTGMDMGF